MNRLYFGDNLKWLSDRKEFPDASVDLCLSSIRRLTRTPITTSCSASRAGKSAKRNSTPSAMHVHFRLANRRLNPVTIRLASLWRDAANLESENDENHGADYCSFGFERINRRRA